MIIPLTQGAADDRIAGMWNLDLWIAIGSYGLTFALAFMGVYVTLHPPAEERKLDWKVGFAAVGALSCLLIAVQTHRNIKSQNQLTLKIGNLQGEMDKIQHNTAQPPVVNVAAPIVRIPPTLRTQPSEPRFQIGSPGFQKVEDKDWPYKLSVDLANTGKAPAFDLSLSAAMIDQQTKSIMRFPDISAGAEISPGQHIPWSIGVKFPHRPNPQFVVLRLSYRKTMHGGNITQDFFMKWRGVSNGVPTMDFSWASIEDEKNLEKMMPEILRTKPLK